MTEPALQDSRPQPDRRLQVGRVAAGARVGMGEARGFAASHSEPEDRQFCHHCGRRRLAFQSPLGLGSAEDCPAELGRVDRRRARSTTHQGLVAVVPAALVPEVRENGRCTAHPSGGLLDR